MKKGLKILVWTVGVIVAVVLLAVLSLPLWISPMVKTAAAVGGPKALGAPVSVGGVSLNPFTGSLAINKVAVGNPSGYSQNNAFAVDKVAVKLKLASLFSDTIVIDKIEIAAPSIRYETASGKANFNAMMEYAQKGASTNAVAQAKPEEKKPEAAASKEGGKKVIINEFSLNGAKVAFATGITMGKAVTIPLPPIVLKDIGKKSNGATIGEVLNEVTAAITEGVGKAASGITSGVGSILSSGKEGGKAADAAAKDVEKAGKGLFDAVKKAVK
jgi:hypothetical protein